MKTVAQSAISSRITYGISVRYTRSSILCLGIVGALITTDGCATHHSVPPAKTSEFGRLSVRPRAMAFGTHTAQAGLLRLDSLYTGDSLISEAFIYVPQQCVGTRRVPLLVLLHGDHVMGRSMINMSEGIIRHFADSLGFILLAPTSHSADRGWGDVTDTAPPNVDVPRIDAAIRQVLKHYAIDPTRIALIGQSAGSGAALDIGYVNGDVFNRVILFAGFGPFWGEHEFDLLKGHSKPAIFIGMNTRESNALKMSTFVPWLRHRGYSVTLAEDSGGHALSMGRAIAGFDWLTKSWR